MKHIVFVIGYYYPEAGSTSLCAIKVMNDLINRYNNVTISCVCGTTERTIVEHLDNKDIYKIHHVSYTDRLDKSITKLDRIITKANKKIKDVINFRHYPDMDREYSKLVFNTLEQIERTKHIDSIVAVYLPKQTVSGVLMFKEKYPNVHATAYFLDTLRSNKPRLLPMKIHTRMIDNYENRIFGSFDRIILMEYGSEYYSKLLCEKYKSKIAYLSLPSLEIMDLKSKVSQGMKCCYVGTTYSDIRNPLYALQVFDEANKRNSNVLFHIYGPSNMKTKLLEWQIQHPRSFKYHDFISHESINSIYEDCDYIVSLGNTRKGVVPGKTFEIFGTLKPIIHFTDVMNDSALKFVKQYPNVCIINYSMSVDEAVDCLLMFLEKPYRMCDSRTVENTFFFAKPGVVSNLIMEQ